MGTDDPAERALLQGLIKVAAAYVHDVRGNPAGIARNLEGARVLLVGRARPVRPPNVAGIDLGALVDAIDARLDDLTAHPDGPTLGPPAFARTARSAPMTMPAPIPTIDVAEAERRLREDPAGPILLDVRERNEFEEVRAPGAVLVPTSEFMTRVAELPADRPLLVVCAMGGRSAAVTGYLVRADGPTSSTWRAGWTPGNGPACRSARRRSTRGRRASSRPG